MNNRPHQATANLLDGPYIFSVNNVILLANGGIAVAKYPDYVKKLWLPEEIEDFTNFATYAEYPSRTVLFWEGDPSDKVFFIAEGYASMFHSTASGKMITVMIHAKGDIIGHGCMMNSTSREICCQTMGKCKLWAISRDDFFNMLFNYPEFAVWVAADLAVRMRKIGYNVKQIISFPAEQRVIHALIELAEGIAENDNTVIRIPVTHQELSNMVGTCRQTTTEVLGNLRKKGMLKTKKGCVEILALKDLQSLLNIAEY